ncbi:MAG TPA: HPr family phosphocarrier protein [Tessaracoccus flavescens]|uniref:Phosphocarrier protein HPr n=1 Tax=Tessaracoccus flavescens TaxID=399497 RepID=A0A921EPC3_9ACTN|nr:HPr family phosphocarrier protein [Tessaracoccus flavescens]
MHQKTVIVGSAVGLHARPAAMIARAAAEYEEEIFIAYDGAHVDASSSLLIMTLGAEHGAEVTVDSDNPEAVEAIAAMIEQDLDS